MVRLRAVRRQMVAVLGVTLIGFAGLLSPAIVHADMLVVTSLADDGSPGTLRDRVTIANGVPGSTITFAPGLSGGTVYLSPGRGPLAIDANTTIEGQVAIDGAFSITVFTVAKNVQVTFTGLKIMHGKAPVSGGALDVDTGAVVNLINCNIFSNTSMQDAGGIFVNTSATVNLTSCYVNGNMAASGHAGGGIDNFGTVNATGTIFSGNSGDYGGAITTQTGATTSIQDSALIGNTASIQGGGLINFYGLLNLYNSEVSGNHADNVNGSSGGGVVITGGTTTILNSTLSGNQANGTNSVGGGVSMNSGIARFINDTLSLNSVSGTNATGGGLSVTGGSASFTNTIIGGNIAPVNSKDFSGTAMSGGFNLIGQRDGSTGWTGNDLTGTNANPLFPHLLPPADNGGKAPQMGGTRPKTPASLPDGTHPKTMAIDGTSPAFHAGLGTTCTAAYPNGANGQDERGPSFPRTASTCSMGAYEPGPTAPPMPTGLHATGATANSVTWDWSESDATAPLIFTVDGVHFYGLAAGTTTFTLYGIAYGSYACMSIAAYNAIGASSYTPYACKNVVPLTPYNPHQTAGTTTTGTISWANYDTLSYEQVYDYSGAAWHQVGQNGTSYTLTGIPAGTYHCAAVQAYNIDYASGYSYACPFAAPNAPTNIHATSVSQTSVTFAWTAPDAYSWYYVYETAPAAGHVVSGTSFTTTHLIASGGHAYACIYVAAGGYGGTSGYPYACAWAY